jgi:hypothetical protein
VERPRLYRGEQQKIEVAFQRFGIHRVRVRDVRRRRR